MGLFDIFKKKQLNISKQETIKTAIPESEKKYYQDDSYYTDMAFSGTLFEKKVICFEERKPQFLQKQDYIPLNFYC